MPVYELTDPQGNVYEVEAPEGATEEQVYSQFQNYMQAQQGGGGQQQMPAQEPMQQPQQMAEPAKPEREEEAWYEDFGEGLGVSGLSTWYGIKDLFGQMDDEDKATLKDWQEDAAQSGWGTAGRVLGEVAQLAIPGGALTKAAKGAQMLKAGSTGARALPFAAEAGLSTGFEALQAPTDEKGRLEAAKEGLTGALVGGTIGRGLTKLFRGANVSKEAKELMDEGVYLTPGQAAEGKFLSGLETASEVTPFLASGVKKAREEATDSWNKLLIKSVAPEGVKVSGVGREAVGQVGDAFRKAYDDAWQGATYIGNEGRTAILEAAAKGANYLDDKSVAILRGVMKDVNQLTKRNVNNPGKALNELDKIIRKKMENAYSSKEIELGETLKTMRAALRDSSGAKDAIAKIDKQYKKYIPVRDAAGRASETKGIFTPKQFATSVRKAGGMSRTGEGKTQMLKAQDLGMETIGKKVGGQPLEWFRRLAGITPALPGMKGAGKAVLGQTASQKYMAELAERLRDRGISGAYIGAAVND